MVDYITILRYNWGMPRKTLKARTGVLKERSLDDGRRKISLRAAERQALLRQERAEAAAALFLDLDVYRSWADIARELGLSAAQLRDLTKTEEFDSAYNQLFAELGHDPRFRATQAAVADLLPMAATKLKELVTAGRTSDSVRLKAIQMIFELNGLTRQQQVTSDRQELAKFLVEHKISFGDLRIAVPEEYQQAMDAVDGEYREVKALPEETTVPDGIAFE